MTEPDYEQLLDPLPVGACVVQRDLTVLHWNRTFSDWTRTSREAVVGRRLDDLYPELREGLVRRRLDQVLAGGPPAIFSAQLHGSVIPVRFPNGSPRYSNTTVSLVRNAEGHRTLGLLVAEDVTNLMERLGAYEEQRRLANRELEERRRAEGRLRAVTDELRRSNRDLSDFAAIAAHDLQAPLRQIVTWAEILLEDPEGPELRQGLQQMMASAAAMRRLVKGILTHSRVGIGPRTNDGVDLGEVLSEITAGMTLDIERLSAAVHYRDLPVLRGDRTLLTQLFTNLISNALKFRVPDVPPVVEVSARRAGRVGGWVIEVRDNGIGFETGKADEIFEMGRRLHPSSRYEGTGIGLATCRRIVESYGGEISATARPGEGSLFTVRWPAEAEPRAQALAN